jgi:hypothetical protein
MSQPIFKEVVDANYKFMWEALSVFVHTQIPNSKVLKFMKEIENRFGVKYIIEKSSGVVWK